MWVQMKALEMFWKFMLVLFMIEVWRCHVDTWRTGRRKLEDGAVSVDFGHFLRHALFLANVHVVHFGLEPIEGLVRLTGEGVPG